MVDCNLHRKILQGDVLEKMKEIPDESIDCVITSPPYLLGIKRLSSRRTMGIRKRFSSIP